MTVVGDPPGLRMEPLARWLGTHAVPLDLSAPLTAELFQGGRSNVTYRLIDGSGASAVLRRPPLGHVLPSAHDMSREYRVISGLSRVGYPVPVPYALCEDEDVIGASFMVMSYVDGRVIADASGAAALTSDEASRISASLVDAMALLHGVDVEEAGLAALGRPAGFLGRQLDRWSRQWELTRTRELPAIDELRARISRMLDDVPTDQPSGLVHGDYRLDNTVLAKDSAQILAVLDWEMSTLGDPVADLALTLLYWTRPDDGLRQQVPITPSVTEQPGFWDRSRIIDEYATRTGANLAHLDACTALACFKLAVITESIHARTMGGKQLGTAVTRAEDMGRATEVLVQLGLNVTELGTIEGLAS